MPGSQLVLLADPHSAGTFELLSEGRNAIALGIDLVPGPISFVGPSMVLDNITPGTYLARYLDSSGTLNQWNLALAPAGRTQVNLTARE